MAAVLSDSGTNRQVSPMLSADTNSIVLLVCTSVGIALPLTYLIWNNTMNGKYAKKSKHPITLLDPQTTVPLTLVKKIDVSHNTKLFRFALPSEEHVLGLPIGQHVVLRYKTSEGKLVSRPYTPVTSNDTVGHMDLVVKVYFKDVHPKFPEGGKMSQHLNDLAIGDVMQVAGPKGKLSYQGNGLMHIRHRPRDTEVEARKAKHIGMIAGGTGITPMLQVIRQAIQDPSDSTKFSVLFANQHERDILLRDELDELSRHPNVKVWYTVDKSDDKDWIYSVGFVDSAMIKEHMPAPGDNTQILLCGPPPMLKFAILPAFEKLGYLPPMFFAF